jgi:NADH-quinone oxidoreductase subunit F
VWKGRKLKAVIPGGSSCPILKPQPAKALAAEGPPPEKWPLETDVPLDVDSLKKVNSMLGSAGMMIFDDQTCVVRSLATLANFYAHESCGQCTPCREGTGWVAKITNKIERGEGTEKDIATLMSATDYMNGMTICVLADSIAMPVKSYFEKFKDEFIDHIRNHKCSFPEAEVAPAATRVWEDRAS